MSNIYRIQNCCRIIRVNVADELCFHLECIILLCPVLKCKVHCARTEVTSADTDLNNCCKLLSGTVCDLTSMYFVRELSNLLLLLYIESTLVYTVSLNSISKLSACHVVKYETLLSCVHNFSVVKCFELLCQLCFFCQFLKSCENCVIHFLRCIIVC